MTVKHLKELQRQQMAAAVSVDPSVLPKYRAGFSECAEEVSRYLSSIDGLSAEMRMRLLSHLSDCMTHVNTATTPYSPPAVHGGLGGYPHTGTTPMAALPGYQQQQHPVHVAYPELLPAEMLARTMLSPMVQRSSPELSPSENRSVYSSHMTSTPRGHAPQLAFPAPTHDVMRVERPREMRPLAELNSNKPMSRAVKDVGVKTERASQGSEGHMEGHVPLHIPLHVDVKQEPMWRPW